MDHKTWLWRKKSTEKTIGPNDLTGFLIDGNEEHKVQAVFIDRAEHEKEVRHLTEKLVSVITDCHLKDDLAKKHENMAQEAAVGRERAEAEVASLKQQLDESLELKIAGEELAAHLDTALKECKQQLRFVREEQEQRIQDAVGKTIRDFEKSQAALGQRLEETTRRLAKMGVENAHLSKSIMSKEKLIEDLTEQMKQAEADANPLSARLESMEKNSASLMYEVRILEKELEIRNEEREFNQRSAEASHKLHLESVKKIAKLEAECQRLRLLVRKRLPGPAAVAQMKNEVEVLGRDSTGRRKINAFAVPMIDSVVDKYPETPTKKINLLTEQLIALQEDNRALKEALYKKVNELQASRMKNGRTRSTCSKVEVIEGSPNARKTTELAPKLDVHYVGSTLDMDSENSIRSSESWSSALISELEIVRSEKMKESVSSKPVGVSDITLMDDFVEMEKLATSSAAEPSEICSSPPYAASTKQRWKDETHISEKRMVKDKSSIAKSVSKLMELVENISLSSENAYLKTDERLCSKNLEGSTEYVVRVFQWKSSARTAVLQDLLHTCCDCLNEKADTSKLFIECVSALEWILNHCFSLKDVSSMRYEILKDLDWDDSRSESEACVGITCHLPDSDKLDTNAGKNSSKATNNVSHLKEFHGDVLEENKKLKEDVIIIGSAKESLEVQLQSVIGEKETLMQQIEASKQTTENGLKEPTGFAEDQVEYYKLITEDLDRQLAEAKVQLNEARQKFLSLEVELENKTSLSEELEAVCLDLQLQLESVKKDDSRNGDFSLLKKQLQPNWELSIASEKLAECQETILNLGKQLKALASPKDATLFDKILQNIPEIATSDTEDLSKAIVPVPSKTEINHRASLLDQMMAEDFLKSSCVSSMEDVLVNPSKKYLLYGGAKSFKSDERVGSLAIVPSKKLGSGSLWRKLLWRKKKGGNKIPSLPPVKCSPTPVSFI